MRLIDADLIGLTDMEILMCNGNYKEALKMLIDKIEHAPTIEPKRKMGKWLDNYQYGYKCSECSAYLEIDCGDVEMNFCPNCGAKMEV